MHHFAPQLRAEQDTTLSLRARQYKKQRKTALTQPEDDSSLSLHPEARSQSDSTTQSHTAAASSQLAQLRVAGLLPDDEDAIPSAPFPHAPPKTPKGHYGPAKIQEAMAKAPTRLFAVTAASRSDLAHGRADGASLKRTHLNLISGIMHRCLLVGDYERAGRAWGMILRTQVAGGNPVDPRNHGRWGIGAEILLRRKTSTASVQSNDADSIFSDEGFELAREYYERLIVQHPSRKTHPNALDERTFYPAMFSLWIFEVCERSKRARNRLQNTRRPSQSSTTMSDDTTLEETTHDAVAQENAIQAEELSQAMEIAERIDRLIVSPPFDKQGSLLHLRGHVGLWISDLVVGKTQLDEDWDMDTSMESEIDYRTALDQLAKLNSGQTELTQAQSFFVRAEASGTRPDAATISSINIRLKEIARQIAKLQSAQNDSF